MKRIGTNQAGTLIPAFFTGKKRDVLIGIQEAIAGLDQARVVLGKAIRRIEELGLPSELT